MIMKKIVLKISEIYQLQIELNGHQDDQNKIPGLLNGTNISIITKYWLNELNKNIGSILDITNNIKNDLIVQYGDKNEDGEIVINFSDNNQINPKYIEFINEWSILLEEEREVEYKPLRLEDFEDVKSELNFPILFKLIEVE
jgi:hypothetical protein